MTNNCLNNKKPGYKKHTNYKKHIIFWIIVLFIAPASWSEDNKTLLVYSSTPNGLWEFQGELTYDNSRAQTTVLALTKATNFYSKELREDFSCTRLEVDSERVFSAMTEGDYGFQTLLEQLELLSRCGPRYAGMYHMKTTESIPENDNSMLSGHFFYRSDPDSKTSFNFFREEQRFIEQLMEVIFTVSPANSAVHEIKIPAINVLTGINPDREVNDDSPTRQPQYDDPTATHTVYVVYESMGRHAAGFKIAASDQKQWLFIHKSHKKWLEDPRRKFKPLPAVLADVKKSNLGHMKKLARSLGNMLIGPKSAPMDIPASRSPVGNQLPAPSPGGSTGRSIDSPLPPIPAQGEMHYSASNPIYGTVPTRSPTPSAHSTSPGASSPGTGSTAGESPLMPFSRLTSIPNNSISNNYDPGHCSAADQSEYLIPAGNGHQHQLLRGQRPSPEHTALTQDDIYASVTIPYRLDKSGVPDCFSEIEAKEFTALHTLLVSTKMKGVSVHKIGICLLNLIGDGQGKVSITNIYDPP